MNMLPLDFGLSIAANLATDLLKWGGEELLTKSKFGTVLRVRLGLLDKETEDQYHRLVTETYEIYFHKHPERQSQDIYDFFRKDAVSKRLYEYVFEGKPVEYSGLENELRAQIGNDYILWRILEKQNLSLEKLILDFFSTYEERERSVTGLSTLRIMRRLTEMEQRWIELTKSKTNSTFVPRLFDLDSPPLTRGFIARKTEIKEYQKRINKQTFITIEGLAGVGKTWIGAQLAKRQKGRNCFWFTFRLGLKDTLESLLWEIGVFLVIHDENELLQMLQDQRPYPLNVKVRQLAQSLIKHSFLLCFDDFQVVQNDPQIVSFFEELRSCLGVEKSQSTKIIIIGFEKPKFMSGDDNPALQGLVKGDVNLWLSRSRVSLSEQMRKELWEKTQGNAKLISLFIQWSTSRHRTSSEIREFIKHLPEQSEIAQYILTRISETLSPDEQQIIQSIAQFREPISASTLGCALGIHNLIPNLHQMVRRHLVESRAGAKYYLHSILLGHYRMSFNPRMLIDFHTEVAKCFENEGNTIESAYHFIQAGLPETAAEVLNKNISALVNSGKANSAIELLEQIAKSNISTQWQVNIDLALGTAYRMAGKFELSVSAFEKSEQESRYLDNHEKRIESLCGIAETRRMQGNYGATLTAYKTAANISNNYNDLKNEGLALCGIGRVLRLTSDYYGALEAYEKAKTVYQNFPDKHGQAEAAWGRARTVVMLGKHKEALDGYRMAEELSRTASDTYRQAEAWWGIGEISRILGNYQEAIKAYENTVKLCQKIGTPYGLAWAIIGLGETYRCAEMNEMAIKAYQRAYKMCDDMGDKYGLAAVNLGLSEISRASHDVNNAIILAKQALEIANSISHRLEAAHATLSILVVCHT